MQQTITIQNKVITEIKFSTKNTLVINNKVFLLPDEVFFHAGFTDSHCHLLGLGLVQSRVNLQNCKSEVECFELLLNAAQNQQSPEDWIIGFGWNEENWTNKKLPTKDLLSRINNPIILYRVDTHSAWANQQALSIANINNRTTVQGGEICLDQNNEPTGILIDNAITLIEKFIPKLTDEKKMHFLENSIKSCLQVGITELHDMNVSFDILQIMKQMADENRMRIRNNVFLEMQPDENLDFGNSDSENLEKKDAKQSGTDLKSDNSQFTKPEMYGKNLFIAGVKFFADGALGSRGAALIEKYNDSETNGLELLTSEQIFSLCSKHAKQNFAIAIHAIGDKANRNVLQAYSKLRLENPNVILRVEHAQILQNSDLHYFSEYGIIPSVQPYHFVSDKEMAISRLGESRLSGAYLWSYFVQNGVKILGGSDFPIESHNPLTGIRAYCGADSADWHVKQNITLEQALKSYSKWAYSGLPAKFNRGELKVGNQADMVVLSKNPLHPESEVLLTIIDGKIEYSRI